MFLKNRPMRSALSSATENNPYAEFGIRVIFIREADGGFQLGKTLHL
jgi:hypothetical protein